MPVEQWAYAAAVLVVAFLIRGTSGFGSGLVAIPLLAAVWPLQRVVPVIALVTAAASLGFGLKERHRADQLGNLVLAALALPCMGFGMVLGHRLHGALRQRTFDVLVTGLLVASGAYLIIT